MQRRTVLASALGSAVLPQASTAQGGGRMVRIGWVATRTIDDLTAAFATMAREPPQGLTLFSDGFAVQHRQRIIDAAMRLRVPVLAGWAVFAESGALCSYGPRLSDSYRRVAYYADRILKGAKPADLPIEQPATFEMVVNLKSAGARALAVPTSALLRADRVIE